MRTTPVCVCWLLNAFCVAQDAAPTGPAAPEVQFVPAFSAKAKFDRPLLVEFTATDPEVAYVVTQPGQILRVPRDPAKEEQAVFFDIVGKTWTDNWEEGLLGFAFDPDYATNGQVYVYWTEKIAKTEGVMAGGRKTRSERQSVISRFATKKNEQGAPIVDMASELRLMQIFQPFGNHNGGTIVFGPDKMLYVALGDGGAANDPFGNSQSKAVLLGKVLRIDVRGATADKPYAIPADNPFVQEEGARGEIWCWGVRNPWRITFDRRTGDLWCGDVGQNRIEEVCRLVKGGNYGWNLMEGTEVFKTRKQDLPIPADLVPPVAEYPHAEGLSVTGGYVYRGKAIPALDGWFVYADFSSCKVWACRESQGAAASVVALGRVAASPSSFAEEPDGELLVTCFDGKVYRLVPGKKE